MTVPYRHTLYQIANTPLRMHPFPHIFVRDVFDPAYYAELLRHLLPPELMKPIKEARPVKGAYSAERFVFPLTGPEVASLPAELREFWSGLLGWLLGEGMVEVLFEKFDPFMLKRFGDQQPFMYNEAMLVDDRTRYSLGPHSDSPSKVITLLFYLPVDDARPHLGTSIYAPRDPAFRCAGGPHYPFDLFERVVTMPYLANCLFAFFKTDNSFHGVEPVRDDNYRRHLLFYDVKVRLEDLKPEANTAATAPKVQFTF